MTDVVRPPVQGDIRIKGPFLEPRSKRDRHYLHYGTDFGPQIPGVAGDEVVRGEHAATQRDVDAGDIRAAARDEA